MKTTGERGDVDLTAPELGPADGDDIVVVPDDPRPHSRGRMRAFLVAAIVVVLGAAAITIGLVNRDDTGTTNLRSVSRRNPTTPQTKKPVVAKPPTKPRVSAPAASAAPTVPPTAAPITAVGPPPVTPTAPPATPPEYPPTVLTWQSTPAALTIKAGGHAKVSMTVSNPTDGTVTLGLPLSCPPVLKPEHGQPIGGGVCVQMAQVMAPHQTLTQQYTIFATNSGDASGTALAAGRYTARFENLFAIRLTINAS